MHLLRLEPAASHDGWCRDCYAHDPYIEGVITVFLWSYLGSISIWFISFDWKLPVLRVKKNYVGIWLLSQDVYFWSINIASYPSMLSAFRYAVFQVASIITLRALPRLIMICGQCFWIILLYWCSLVPVPDQPIGGIKVSRIKFLLDALQELKDYPFKCRNNGIWRWSNRA